MDLREIISEQKNKVSELLDHNERILGEILHDNGECQILSQSLSCFELIIYDSLSDNPIEISIKIEDSLNVYPEASPGFEGWNRYSYACLLQVENELKVLDPKTNEEHKRYSREGMIKRVLDERRFKAEKADYSIKWARNIYGDHLLTNERGVKYKVFLRDFEKEIGYSDSADARKNKLGTTKHIMYAFNMLKEDKNISARMSKTFPFVEVYCDPLNDYKITWYYPNDLSLSEKHFISKYFKNNSYIEDEELTRLLDFFDEAESIPSIEIRPEVKEKVEAAFEQKLLGDIKKSVIPDYTDIKADLYPYQKEGVEFCLFKKYAIIADEMGLGKTLQAITSAVLKMKYFGFRKILVVCPASLKEQWKKEIEKFSSEKAVVVQGSPEERESLYLNSSESFIIVNYEAVLRDFRVLNEAGIDFMILDEAQKVKNYETKTASAVNNVQTNHTLVITGTPIENKLIDIYSILNILDPHFLGPLWEFSYQHCLFDPEKPNKINGYFDLQKLNKKLNEVLIRREKRDVLEQLPNVQQINIPVELSSLQSDYHSSYANGISRIIRKKFLTPFDLQKLQMLLTKMRMVCDSTYLVDEETNDSPKMAELENILLEQLDLKNSKRKIIIFSEWVKVHKLIGRFLRENNIGFAELNGKIPVKSRGELIHKFETNEHCKVFLSTEAGGSGLNLQVADTLINFELPWNPAKKNQRIGRIDRLGQKSSNLTIFNLITRQSIEQHIAAGLLVKQNLFDGVLGDGGNTNFVDFSSKGRSQFIQQLEAFVLQEEKPEEFSIETKVDEFVEEVPGRSPKDEIDLSDENEEVGTSQNESLQKEQQTRHSPTPEQVEEVMNSGMQFLSGLFKMSTGNDMGFEDQKIEVNKETGEVTMKFKLPMT
ncbi:MAG: DEAD/DEAH box helicase [Prolixibacteraceae bacterium]|nr:DEAD/DEAH box helicase [Prolixibacteraceae bacterium]MBN2650339.1 DEAD/DEAH box helicase [Prolixibacteraceae bacterium]